MLDWPSVAGETYIVQYRPTLDTNTPWVTLTNSLPAATAANRTSFVHSNVVEYCAGSGGGGGGSGGPPAPPGGQSTAVTVETDPLAGVPWWDRWQFENREPYSWEKKRLPPSPWDPEVVAIMELGAALADANIASGRDGSVESLSSECPGSTGFYQVVRDGVHVFGLSGLTNTTLSGVIPVAFEAGDPRGVLSSAVLLANGVKCRGAKVLSVPISYPWQFAVDTAFLPNGTHTIEIDVTWQNLDTTDVNNIYYARLSPPFAVSVANPIYYPQWEEEVGEANIASFFLQTSTPNLNWQIDITDTNGGHLKTLSGQTSTGAIETYWNLVDKYEISHTNADTEAFFLSTTTLSSGPASPLTRTNPPVRRRKRDWPDHARWVISFQDYFKYDYSQNGEMLESINAVALTAANYGGYYLYYPPPGATNDIGQTYPLRYKHVNHPDTNVTAKALALDALMLEDLLSNTNSRNFDYNGHGSDASIAQIPSATLAALIHHRYRFVFLDGCRSSNGDLDDAFGIHGPGRFSLIYYQNTGTRPAAFCGYSTGVSYAIRGPVVREGQTWDNEIPWQVPAFIFNFLFYWDDATLGWTLVDALEQAAEDVPSVPEFQNQPGDNLEIFGYDDLRIDEYNHRSNWP